MANQRQSGYVRKERDFYPTPAWVTDALVKHIPLPPHIWEPASGQDHIVKALEKHSFAVRATDLEPQGRGMKLDFLADHGYTAPAVVTNPPFTLATEFVEQALRVTAGSSGVVAMLLPTDYDHAKKRCGIFRDCPMFAYKLVLTKRIRWFEGTPEDKGKQPMGNHAWFVWKWSHKGNAEILYE